MQFTFEHWDKFAQLFPVDEKFNDLIGTGNADRQQKAIEQFFRNTKYFDKNNATDIIEKLHAYCDGHYNITPAAVYQFALEAMYERWEKTKPELRGTTEVLMKNIDRALRLEIKKSFEGHQTGKKDDEPAAKKEQPKRSASYIFLDQTNYENVYLTMPMLGAFYDKLANTHNMPVEEYKFFHRFRSLIHNSNHELHCVTTLRGFLNFVAEEPAGNVKSISKERLAEIAERFENMFDKAIREVISEFASSQYGTYGFKTVNFIQPLHKKKIETVGMDKSLEELFPDTFMNAGERICGRRNNVETAK